MTAIPNDGLEEIGERAFSGCISLGKVLMPPSVREIKRLAFDKFEDCDSWQWAGGDWGGGFF
jgi:hypothetical protein